MPVVPVEELREIVIAHLQKAGAPAEPAHAQASMLIEAELRGLPSHGVLRLPRLLRRVGTGVVDPVASGAHAWRASGWLDVDGQNGFGPYVAERALAEAARRLPSAGCVLVTISRNNHLGMLSWYAERAAQAGHVLIATTTSEALVHPWQGSRAMVGTNPLAIGVPAEPEPFVIDMATSLVSMGRIHDFANRGEPLPEGWARDAEGAPTTDASAATEGSIAPFGGPKGYALGLALGVLVAGLTGTSLGRAVQGTLTDAEAATKGDLFILAEQRGGNEPVAVGRYLEQVRSSPPAEPGVSVRVPGDRTAHERDLRRREGITVPDTVWSQLASFDTTDSTTTKGTTR
jgi:LDH2 family malate/lactate/ureidoglycolate dehydrogenase